MPRRLRMSAACLAVAVAVSLVVSVSALLSVREAVSAPPGAGGGASSGEGKPAPSAGDKGSVAKDAAGDPLPAGAVARLGTLRWRAACDWVRVLPGGTKALLSWQGRLRELDLKTGEVGAPLPGDEVEFPFGAISPDGKRIVMHTGRAFQVLTVADGKTVDLPLDGLFPSAATWNADGQGFAALLMPSGFDDDDDATPAIRFYDASGKALRTQVLPGETASRLGDIGNKLDTAVMRLRDGRMAWVDTKTGKITRRFGPSPAGDGGVRRSVSMLEFLPSDDVLLTWFEFRETGEHRHAEPPAGRRGRLGRPDPLAEEDPSDDADPAAEKSVRKIAVYARDSDRVVFEAALPETAGEHFLSPDGKAVWAADLKNGGIHVIPLEAGKPARVVKAPRFVAEIHRSIPGAPVVVRSMSTLGTWDPATDTFGGFPPGTCADVTEMRLLPDGGTATLAYRDGTIQRWSLADGTPKEESVKAGDEDVVHFDAPAGLILRRKPDGPFEVFDAGGKLLHATRPQPTDIDGAEVAADGSLLALAVAYDELHLLPLRPAGERLILRGNGGGIGGLRMTPDGKHLAVASRPTGPGGGSVLLWDLAKRKVVHRFRGHQSAPAHMAITADGKRLATSGQDEDKSVRVWDLSTGRQVQWCVPFTTHAAAPVWSPDGKLLALHAPEAPIVPLLEDRRRPGAAGGRTLAEGRVVVWDPVKDEDVAKLTGLTGPVKSVVFSADGTRLAAAGRNGIAVWSVPEGKLLHRFDGHNAAVSRLAFSADGRTLVSASDDTTAVVWRVGGSDGK